MLWLWLACAQPENAAVSETPLTQEVLERESNNGPVTVVVRAQPAELKLGDPLQLELEVRAEAEIEIEMPPFGEALGRFSIVDFTPSQSEEADQRTYLHRYTLQAPMSGPQTIPALRIEYIDNRAGQDSSPKELLSDELTLNVQSLLPEDAPLGFLPPRGELSLQRPTPWWVWLLVAVPIVGALAWWLRRRWLAAQAAERRRSAYENAIDALRRLEQEELGSADLFYERLSELLRAYISDRFTLNALQWTTEELLDAVRSVTELQESSRDSLRQFCQRADEVKFAQNEATDAQRSSELIVVRSWLEDTRVVEEVTT